MKPEVFQVKDVVCRNDECYATIQIDYEYYKYDLRELVNMRDKLDKAINLMQKLKGE